jgi:hypothetical protein
MHCLPMDTCATRDGALRRRSNSGYLHEINFGAASPAAKAGEIDAYAHC